MRMLFCRTHVDTTRRSAVRRLRTHDSKDCHQPAACCVVYPLPAVEYVKGLDDTEETSLDKNDPYALVQCGDQQYKTKVVQGTP